MALSDARAHRRRIARRILAALILLHLLAVGAYLTQSRQQALLVRFLEARDQWRDGHLDAAASVYRDLINTRTTVAWPFVLIRNYPSAADTWYLLGRVESDRHQNAAALTAYRNAIHLGGRGTREFRNLLLDAERPDELLHWADEAIAHDRSAPQPYKDRGAALLALGRPHEASIAYAAALAYLPAWRRQFDPAAPSGLSGEEADLWNLYAAAMLAAGDAEAATRACAQVTQRQSKTEALDRLCQALLVQHAGRPDEARRLLAGYLPPAPEHDRLMHGLFAAH